MNGQGYLTAAYLVAAAAYGGYLLRLRQRAKSLHAKALRLAGGVGEQARRG